MNFRTIYSWSASVSCITFVQTCNIAVIAYYFGTPLLYWLHESSRMNGKQWFGELVLWEWTLFFDCFIFILGQKIFCMALFFWHQMVLFWNSSPVRCCRWPTMPCLSVSVNWLAISNNQNNFNDRWNKCCTHVQRKRDISWGAPFIPVCVCKHARPLCPLPAWLRRTQN